MDFFQGLFLSFFGWIYPLIHSKLVSYCLIALLAGTFVWFNWKWIKSLHRKRGFFAALCKGLFILLELFVLGFLVWFILIYFHTFLN